jgi:DNA polymerase-3 subunit epsilon
VKLLGFDTETTGLDTKIDEVTEVGLVLWDTDEHQPVRMTGCLVKTTFAISSEITRITGITQSMIDKYGMSSAAVLRGILNLAKNADFFCAHNAEFDRGMLETWCVREGQPMPAIPWIDTRTDLPPAAYELGKSASLRYLACDHGFLYSAHRALADVQAMLKILDMYDIETIVKRARTPNVQVRAVVSFDDRLLAKERGYYWRPELKLWVKPLKLDAVDAEKAAAPFPVVLMEKVVS